MAKRTGRPPHDPQADYEVGYGKPPEHSRFKKGTSGNPKGRPPKDESIRARIQAYFDRKVTSSSGETMTYSDAVLMTAMNGLLGKGGRSVKTALELIRFLESFDRKVGFVVTPADEERLNELLRGIGPALPDWVSRK